MALRRYLLSLCLYFIGQQLFAFQLALDNGSGKLGLINTNTQEVILPKQYDQIGWNNANDLVQNGLVRAKKNEKWALFSQKGKRLTQHEYITLLPTANKRFIASKRADNSILQYFGLINATGKALIPFEYVRLEQVNERLLATKKVDGGFEQVLFDLKGQKIIDGDYKRIFPLNDNYFGVLNRNDLQALFDQFGTAVTAFEFQAIDALSQKYFLISYYNRLGVIDGQGKLVIEPIYRRIFQRQDEIKTEAYPEWTVFKTEDQQRYNFDYISGLGDSLYFIQTDDYVGVINDQERYRVFLENHELSTSNDHFVVIRNLDNNYLGLISDAGEQILPSIYDNIIILNDFALGKINRNSGENWFAFDRKGHRINPNGYEDIVYITENEEVICTRAGKLGLLSSNGTESTPFEFLEITAAHQNQYIARNERGVGIMNKNGIWLTTPYRDEIKYFGDHYTFIQGSANGHIDLEGKLQNRSYDSIGYLPGGFYQKSDSGLIPFKSEQEEALFDYQYDTVYALNDQIWYLERDDKQFFYRYALAQSTAIPEHTTALGQFKGGFISFKQNGQWGFLDELGQLRIANRYEAVSSFSEGLAPVKLIGKWGVINPEEEIVVQPKYDSISSYSNALAVVQYLGKYGLIDRTGRDVLQAKYDLITRHKEWMELTVGPLKGISDRRGRLVRSPQFNAIEYLGNGNFKVTKGSKQGIVNSTGQELVPAIYDLVKPFKSGFLAQKKGKIVSYPIK